MSEVSKKRKLIDIVPDRSICDFDYSLNIYLKHGSEVGNLNIMDNDKSQTDEMINVNNVQLTTAIMP